MAEQVLFVCYFDGTIQIDAETRVPKYASGYCKPLIVRPPCTHRELMDKIYELSAVTRRSWELRVLCKWWFDNGECAPINVRDDQDTAAVLAYARKQTSVQLFVRHMVRAPSSAEDEEEDWDEEEEDEEEESMDQEEEDEEEIIDEEEEDEEEESVDEEEEDEEEDEEMGDWGKGWDSEDSWVSA